MLRIEEKLTDEQRSEVTLTLSFELRQKTRLRAVLDDGREAALMLPRGQVLRSGECLRALDGTIIVVRAAQETVSTASTTDALLLARACYHLGNRHVPLQIGSGWCRYLHDHVLDDMVIRLGLNVRCEQAMFEPENGAYASGHSGYHHGGHDHD